MKWIDVLAATLVFASCEILAKPVAQKVEFDVEIEETIYYFSEANNGAGPLWDHGSTNIVRIGENIFVSGLDTLKDIPPLNNTQCRIWRRDDKEWKSVALPVSGHTREPCPLVTFPLKREIFLSANPTLNPPGLAGAGPAKPSILRFHADDVTMTPTVLSPSWRNDGPLFFTEHSYRSFAADGQNGELILFQNVGNDYAEWTFRNEKGDWSFSGKLKWPWGGEYNPARSIRLAYPNILLANRSMHFVGVSNIVEPNDIWRDYKMELTKRKWDYVFRRLFYTWTPDVSNQDFVEWIEIANLEETGGRINLGDMWRASDGCVHVVWDETTLDQRLRSKFIQNQKQSYKLKYAVLCDGKLKSKHDLMVTEEGESNVIPYLPRLHATPDGKLFAFFYVSGFDSVGNNISENRIVEVNSNGTIGQVNRIPFHKPFGIYMTANSRTGSSPSPFIDLIGMEPGKSNEIRYARVKLK